MGRIVGLLEAGGSYLAVARHAGHRDDTEVHYWSQWAPTHVMKFLVT